MKKDIEMRFAGMDFLLTVDIDEDDEYAGIFAVKVWNEEDREYYDVTFNKEQFEEVFKDAIIERVEDYKESRKEIAAEMIYDAMKEEGKI
jgi:hypothetical protein